MSDSFQEGKRLAKAGEFEAALPLLEQASREQPDSPDVWLALGSCYFRVDRNDDYREAMRQALALDPDHGPTLRFLKKTTGAEVIPAPDTGREKIFMEAGEGPKLEEESPKPAGSGCLGALLFLPILVFAAKFFLNHLDSRWIFQLY
ncbi:MAG: tetratricopeptide repeat protein [Candidatus Omnitrophica bacterium]|nr:tetratricopeptide repeat protein [Candidatus Omnitrophota bacterium]